MLFGYKKSGGLELIRAHLLKTSPSSKKKLNRRQWRNLKNYQEKIMAYNKFKTETLNELLGIEVEFKNIIPETLPDFKPSALLLTILNDAQLEALGTEKSKSEHIVLPVIKELKRQNPNKFSYFSGYKFDVDKKLSLTGYCDFILSSIPNTPIIKTPVFLLVEAKNGEIENGIGQCGAEMYAAQLFNQQHQHPQPAIYGCVTNAFTWCFLKLENKTLYIDSQHIPLTLAKPDAVLAALQWTLNQCVKE
jgi:hypothetical protein